MPSYLTIRCMQKTAQSQTGFVLLSSVGVGLSLTLGKSGGGGRENFGRDVMYERIKVKKMNKQKSHAAISYLGKRCFVSFLFVLFLFVCVYFFNYRWRIAADFHCLCCFPS